ncbi:MAG: GPP34 family phosphoprotein [Acidobacteriota bacterium]
MKRLAVHDEVLLLALCNRKGTVRRWAAMYRMALGGAIVGELLESGHLEIAGVPRRFVEATDRSPLEDPVLGSCLQRVASATRRKDVVGWVGAFARQGDLRAAIAMALCREGILREDERRLLGIFRQRVYPEVDPGPERAIRARIERAVEGEAAPDARTALLVSVLHAAMMLPVALDRSVLHRRRARILMIASGGAGSDRVRQAIAPVHAAVTAWVRSARS